jgi:Fe-S-cluster containining protein
MVADMSLPIVGQAHVCQRCAQFGPTCCQPENGVALAPLTPGDIERITRATGLNASVFTTARTLDVEELEALEEQEPVLKGLVGPDRRLVSLTVVNGACALFSNHSGCTLRYESRPLLCRRYPIVRNRRWLSVSPGGRCLAVEEASDMPSLLGLLGMTEDGLVEIDRQLRADLRRPKA